MHRPSSLRHLFPLSWLLPSYIFEALSSALVLTAHRRDTTREGEEGVKGQKYQHLWHVDRRIISNVAGKITTIPLLPPSSSFDTGVHLSVC